MSDQGMSITNPATPEPPVSDPGGMEPVAEQSPASIFGSSESVTAVTPNRDMKWKNYLPASAFEEPGETVMMEPEPEAQRHPSMFRLLQPVGRGGMGEVWSAVQTNLNRVVAVKKLRKADNQREDTIRRARFRDEALTAARLDHPNIIPIYDLGRDEAGQPLLAMKLVKGRPWQELIDHDRNSMAWEDYLAKHLLILISMGQAVAFAHARGIVHRDLKPHQVVVGDFGEVYLMDWGLAMAFDRELARGFGDATATFDLPTADTAPNPAGTPSYMAPEQAELSAKRIGPWTDVYLLGGTLYHVLAGRPPRGRTSSEEMRRLVVAGRFVPLSDAAGKQEVPESLLMLVDRCMAPDPKARRLSAADFVQALQDYLSGAGRRAESMTLTSEVEKALARGLETYPDLADALAKVNRARSLWSGNPMVTLLRDRTLVRYSEVALANNDMLLARVQAERIEDPRLRAPLLMQITQGERAEARRNLMRRGAYATAALLAIIMTGGTLYFNNLLARRTAVAEDAMRQARESSTAMEASQARLESQLYQTKLTLAAGLLQSGSVEAARERLLETPVGLRDIEWGVLYAHATPERWRTTNPAGATVAAASSVARPEVWLLGERGTITRHDFTTNTWTTLASPVPFTPQIMALDGTGGYMALADERGNIGTIELKGDTSSIMMTGQLPEIAKSAEWTPNSRGLFVGGVRGSVSRIDSQTGARTWESRLHESSVQAVAVAPIGGAMATGSDDLDVCVVEGESGVLRHRLYGHTMPVLALKFDNSGTTLASAGADARIITWDVATGRRLTTMEVNRSTNEGARIRSVRWTGDGESLIALSEDRVARVFNANTGVLQRTITSHEQPWLALTTTSDADLVATASANGTLAFWSWNAQRQVVPLVGHIGQVAGRGFTPDGRLALTAGHDNTLRLWESETGNEMLRIMAPLGRCGYVDGRISATGNLIVATSRANKVIVYDRHGGGELYSADLPNDFDDVAIDPTESLVAAVGMNGMVQIHQWRLQKRIDTQGPAANSVCATFTPDGRELAVGFRDGSVHFFDVTDGRITRTINLPAMWAEWIAFSQESPRRMLVASFDNDAHVYDLRSGRLLHTLKGHRSWVSGGFIAPGGRRAVTVATDGTIRFWDMATGDQVLELQVGPVPVHTADLSPDHRRMLLGMAEGQAQIWPVAAWNQPDTRVEDWQRAGFENWLNLGPRRELPKHESRIRYLAAGMAAQSRWSLLTLMDEMENDPETARLARGAGGAWQEARQRLMAAGESAPLKAMIEPLLPTLTRERAPVSREELRRSAETLETRFAPYLRGPLHQFRTSANDPLGGRRLRILCLLQEPEEGRSIFIVGNRPEIGSWLPNEAALTRLGEATNGGVVYELSLGYRHMEFKFTLGNRGDAFEVTQEWEGPRNRFIAPDQLMWMDADGNVVYTGVFGQLP